MGFRQYPVFQRTAASEADIIGLPSTFVERAATLASTLVPGVVVVTMVIAMVVTMVIAMVIAVVVIVVVLSAVRILWPTALRAGVPTAACMIFGSSMIRLAFVAVLGERWSRQHNREDACHQKAASQDIASQINIPFLRQVRGQRSCHPRTVTGSCREVTY